MNIGYIATTLDGFIADLDGRVSFLDSVAHIDTGYDTFIDTIDIIIMGKASYEAILSFDIAGTISAMFACSSILLLEHFRSSIIYSRYYVEV